MSSSLLLLIDVTAKSTLILMLACVAVALCRKQSAAARHHIWFVAILLLPVVTILGVLLPGFAVPVADWLPATDIEAVASSVATDQPIALEPEERIEFPQAVPNQPAPLAANSGGAIEEPA